MEKIIEIDLLETDDFFETYNRKKVSRELINYLISEGQSLKKEDKVKIVVNDLMNEDIDCVKLIKKGLRQEYEVCYQRHQNICIKQLIYLICGVDILFLSTLIDSAIFREVVVIFGWVLLWSMFELEIFSDVDSKKRRNVLKKLLDSEFEEKEGKKQ